MLNLEEEELPKYLSLDAMYIYIASITILLIVTCQNILDVIYLGVLTFYYVRVKLHRKGKV